MFRRRAPERGRRWNGCSVFRSRCWRPRWLESPGGHCVFTQAEVQGALALLVSQVAAQALAVH